MLPFFIYTNLYVNEMDLLNNHATIREFIPKPIDKRLLESIIYAGTHASTTGNMQLYSVIVTQDKTNIKKLAPLHFNQSLLNDVPALLTFVADFNRFSTWCLQNNATPGYNNFLSFLTASIDALIVAQNVALSAENYGLGVCYLGTTIYNASEIIDVLNLPQLTFPITSLAIGYPVKQAQRTDRLPLKGIIHYEKYAEYTAQRIDELYGNEAKNSWWN